MPVWTARRRLSANRFHIFGHLPRGDIGLHEHRCGVKHDTCVLATNKSRVPVRSFSECAGVGERVWVPGQERNAGPYGVEQDLGIAQPRQVEVLAVVAPELLEADVIATPQRHSVEVHPKPGSGVLGDERFLVAELLRHPHGERVGPADPRLLPRDGRVVRRLGTARAPRRRSLRSAV